MNPTSLLRNVGAFLGLILFVSPHVGHGQEKSYADPSPKIPRTLPGMLPSGMIQLPNQWSLAPTGTQIKLGDFPVHIELHPSQPFAAISHAGYGEHEIIIVSLTTKKIVSSVVVPQTFYGLLFSSDGKTLYASGGDDEVVYAFCV